MTSPIVVQEYPHGIPELGQIQEWSDGRKFIGLYYDGGVDALSPNVCQKGQLAYVGEDIDNVYSPQIHIPVNGAILRKPVVVCEDLAAAALRVVWCQSAGICKFAHVDGDADVVVGDPLQGETATSHLIDDTGEALTTDSIAIALTAEAETIEDQITAGTEHQNTIYLLDREVIIG